MTGTLTAHGLGLVRAKQAEDQARAHFSPALFMTWFVTSN